LTGDDDDDPEFDNPHEAMAMAKRRAQARAGTPAASFAAMLESKTPAPAKRGAKTAAPKAYVTYSLQSID
jgi:hypothetical protein